MNTNELRERFLQSNDRFQAAMLEAIRAHQAGVLVFFDALHGLDELQESVEELKRLIMEQGETLNTQGVQLRIQGEELRGQSAELKALRARLDENGRVS